ncbi:MAG: hypothetical protein LBK83_11250 [Treponema sp.]|jgi:hypothetical protein|nr:hypothetical protein [Treponema sp.]
MASKKLMKAAETVVRINGLLKEEGWEIIQFQTRPGPWGGPRLELEIAPIDEDPTRGPKPQD